MRPLQLFSVLVHDSYAAHNSDGYNTVCVCSHKELGSVAGGLYRQRIVPPTQSCRVVAHSEMKLAS